jgi:hypothetical protein
LHIDVVAGAVVSELSSYGFFRHFGNEGKVGYWPVVFQLIMIEGCLSKARSHVSNLVVFWHGGIGERPVDGETQQGHS